jgi:hypothetical protein
MLNDQWQYTVQVSDTTEVEEGINAGKKQPILKISSC